MARVSILVLAASMLGRRPGGCRCPPFAGAAYTLGPLMPLRAFAAFVTDAPMRPRFAARRALAFRLLDWRLFHPRDGLAGELFNGVDQFAVHRRDDRDRRAGAPRAPGAADAVDVIVRMMRHVEI